MPKTLKRVHAPHLGHDVAVGGARPVHLTSWTPRLHFGDFILDPSLTAPTTTNFRASADRALRKMYLNDQLGDCVIAARYHRIGLLTGAANAGNPFVATDAQVKSDYHDIGGYVDGSPSTDQGCDMITAADFGVSHGYADGSKDLGYIIVDATNREQVKLAMWAFENLDIAIPLPDKWISPFPSADGFTWGVDGDSNPENGHCIPGIDIATNGIVIDTWALEGVITFEALAAYAVDKTGGVIIVHLNPDMLAKAMTKAPNGIDWVGIITAFNALGGKISPPGPSPTPAPTPPPTPPMPPVPDGVTLAQAQAWAKAAIEKGGPKSGQITRSHAVSLAEAGLAAGWPKP